MGNRTNRRGASQAAPKRPIIPSQPDLRFEHGPEHPFLAVRDLILRHVGAAKAITIEGIAQELWPVDWNYVRQNKNMPEYPHRADLQRQIKEIVRRLRRKDKRIGSSRDSAGGYYLISNSDELVSTLKPYFDQALSMLETVHEMTGMDLFLPELRGKRAQLANQKLAAAEGAKAGN
jgi:hypothetical protein